MRCKSVNIYIKNDFFDNLKPGCSVKDQPGLYMYAYLFIFSIRSRSAWLRRR